MKFTEAEIKRIARERSDGCSARFNQIKRELEIYNESVSDEPEPEEEPPEAIPEVIFVRKFFAWSFSILFVLMVTLVIVSSFSEAS